MQKVILKSLADTEKLAQSIARDIKGGEVIALIGDLGAGKTTFTKALATVFGIDPNKVTSPTFVLMKEYPIAKSETSTIKKIIHIDAYRLNDGQSLLDIGVSDYFNDPTVITVIEWADRVQEILPNNTFNIHLEVFRNNRKVTIQKIKSDSH